MGGDGCRGFCTKVLRGLDGSRVANFLDDQRQSHTRQAQDLFNRSNSGSRFAIIAGRLAPVIKAMQKAQGCTGVAAHLDISLAFPSTLVPKQTKLAHRGSFHRPPWLGDEHAPAPSIDRNDARGADPPAQFRNCSQAPSWSEACPRR